ncbi:MAG: superoxide dismutase family protein [Bdellovibrionales bacterium]|nr:superoxide dismutase family protein [Bdellovibrionales bacterium]
MLRKKWHYLIITSLLTISCQHFGKFYKDSCSKRSSCKYKNKRIGLAKLVSFNDSSLEGSISFEEKGKDHFVQVKAKVEGLKPNQHFSFKVYEFGNCENKGLMAGSQLHSKYKKHKKSHSKDKAFVDLKNLNLTSDEKGNAEVSFNIKSHLKMLMGRSVIVHVKEDNLKNQVKENSKKLACGIIGVSSDSVALKTMLMGPKVILMAKAEKTSKEKPMMKSTPEKTSKQKPMNSAPEKTSKQKPMNSAPEKTSKQKKSMDSAPKKSPSKEYKKEATEEDELEEKADKKSY